MLIVFGEHLHDVESVLSFGTTSVEETTGPRSKGLIEATVARQLSLKNRWAEARTWYARALSRPPSSIEQLDFNALIDGARTEQGFSLATSIAYLERAIDVADGSDDLIGAAGQFAARAELAVALLLNDDQDRAIALWDEAGRRLLNITPEDAAAKGKIGLFLRHSSYFYFSAAGLIGRMQLLPPERRPVAPQIGEFHADLRLLGAHVDSSWRGRVALLLGKIAAVRGQQTQAAEYGRTALIAFNGATGVSAVVLEEANRLASGLASPDPDRE